MIVHKVMAQLPPTKGSFSPTYVFPASFRPPKEVFPDHIYYASLIRTTFCLDLYDTQDIPAITAATLGSDAELRAVSPGIYHLASSGDRATETATFVQVCPTKPPKVVQYDSIKDLYHHLLASSYINELCRIDDYLTLKPMAYMPCLDYGWSQVDDSGPVGLTAQDSSAYGSVFSDLSGDPCSYEEWVQRIEATPSYKAYTSRPPFQPASWESALPWLVAAVAIIGGAFIARSAYRAFTAPDTSHTTTPQPTPQPTQSAHGPITHAEFQTTFKQTLARCGYSADDLDILETRAGYWDLNELGHNNPAVPMDTLCQTTREHLNSFSSDMQMLALVRDRPNMAHFKNPDFNTLAADICIKHGTGSPGDNYGYAAHFLEQAADKYPDGVAQAYEVYCNDFPKDALNFPGSVSFLKNAAKHNPSNQDIHTLCLESLLLSQNADCIDYANVALQHFPHVTGFYEKKASCLMSKVQPYDALQTLDEGLAQCPPSEANRLKFMKATIYMFLRSPESSLKSIADDMSTADARITGLRAFLQLPTSHWEYDSFRDKVARYLPDYTAINTGDSVYDVFQFIGRLPFDQRMEWFSRYYSSSRSLSEAESRHFRAEAHHFLVAHTHVAHFEPTKGIAVFPPSSVEKVLPALFSRESFDWLQSSSNITLGPYFGDGFVAASEFSPRLTMSEVVDADGSFHLDVLDGFISTFHSGSITDAQRHYVLQFLVLQDDAQDHTLTSASRYFLSFLREPEVIHSDPLNLDNFHFYDTLQSILIQGQTRYVHINRLLRFIQKLPAHEQAYCAQLEAIIDRQMEGSSGAKVKDTYPSDYVMGCLYQGRYKEAYELYNKHLRHTGRHIYEPAIMTVAKHLADGTSKAHYKDLLTSLGTLYENPFYYVMVCELEFAQEELDGAREGLGFVFSSHVRTTRLRQLWEQVSPAPPIWRSINVKDIVYPLAFVPYIGFPIALYWLSNHANSPTDEDLPPSPTELGTSLMTPFLSRIGLKADSVMTFEGIDDSGAVVACFKLEDSKKHVKASSLLGEKLPFDLEFELNAEFYRHVLEVLCTCARGVEVVDEEPLRFSVMPGGILLPDGTICHSYVRAFQAGIRAMVSAYLTETPEVKAATVKSKTQAKVATLRSDFKAVLATIQTSYLDVQTVCSSTLEQLEATAPQPFHPRIRFLQSQLYLLQCALKGISTLKIIEDIKSLLASDFLSDECDGVQTQELLATLETKMSLLKKLFSPTQSMHSTNKYQLLAQKLTSIMARIRELESQVKRFREQESFAWDIVQNPYLEGHGLSVGHDGTRVVICFPEMVVPMSSSYHILQGHSQAKGTAIRHNLPLHLFRLSQHEIINVLEQCGHRFDPNVGVVIEELLPIHSPLHTLFQERLKVFEAGVQAFSPYGEFLEALESNVYTLQSIVEMDKYATLPSYPDAHQYLQTLTDQLAYLQHLIGYLFSDIRDSSSFEAVMARLQESFHAAYDTLGCGTGFEGVGNKVQALIDSLQDELDPSSDELEPGEDTHPQQKPKSSQVTVTLVPVVQKFGLAHQLRVPANKSIGRLQHAMMAMHSALARFSKEAIYAGKADCDLIALFALVGSQFQMLVALNAGQMTEVMDADFSTQETRTLFSQSRACLAHSIPSRLDPLLGLDLANIEVTDDLKACMSSVLLSSLTVDDVFNPTCFHPPFRLTPANRGRASIWIDVMVGNFKDADGLDRFSAQQHRSRYLALKKLLVMFVSELGRHDRALVSHAIALVLFLMDRHVPYVNIQDFDPLYYNYQDELRQLRNDYAHVNQALIDCEHVLDVAARLVAN